MLLVGDAPYYGRFGFTAEATGALWMPGPYERERLLARELVPGALDGARGLVRATGDAVPKPDLRGPPRRPRTTPTPLPPPDFCTKGATR